MNTKYSHPVIFIKKILSQTINLYVKQIKWPKKEHIMLIWLLTFNINVPPGYEI